MQGELTDTVFIAHRAKAMYTSKIYRLLVYLYVPLILIFPFLTDHHALIKIITGIATFYLLYSLPDIFEKLSAPDVLLAKKEGPVIHLFLEDSHRLDLREIEKIRISTGVFPVSLLKVEILHNDGSTSSLKTRILQKKLVFFLQNLEQKETSLAS